MSKKAPAELIQGCADHAKKGDLEGWMTLFEPGAAFATPDGEVKSGDDLRQFVAQMAGMKPEFKMNVLKVLVAGDIALIHNEWSIPAQGMAGYGLEVARRQADGSWRLVIDDPFTVASHYKK
jgi:ketosteroid isomerase-like protein